MPISYKKRFSDGLKIVADFDFIEGRFECVRLEIRPAPNTGLKATDPRRVKLGEIKEWVRQIGRAHV